MSWLNIFNIFNLFYYPAVLLFLAVPLALLFWVWRREGGRVVLPFDHGRPGSGRGWYVVLNLMESMPPLLLAVAVCLLAGPKQLGEPKDKRVLTNIEFCLDISGSMTAEFGDGSRYDTAMKSVNDFLDYRKGDAFGLTFFGNSYLHWVPLTTDVSAIRCAPPFMRPESVPPWFNGTEIGKALRACKKVLAERQEGDRMILLITDGDSFDLFNGADLEIAKEMKEAGITVFAVIIGMSAIQDEIINIVHSTGGDAWLAGDASAMPEIFRRIDQMKQTKLEKTIAETIDDFYPYCVAGLVLLGTSMLASFGLRVTPW